MAIGEGMLATGLQEYLVRYAQQFADFLFGRYNEGEGSVFWSVEDTNEKLLRLSLTVIRNDSVGNPMSEDEFKVTIEIKKTGKPEAKQAEKENEKEEKEES